MSHALAELLEAATPEPQRLLNPEELLSAARRRVTLRRRAGGGLGVAVLAGAATAALLVPSGGHQSPGATGGTDTLAVSALDTTGPLPAAVTRALARSPFLSTGRGTLVRQIGREQVYLAPVNNGELICIVDLDATGQSMTCAPRSALLSTGVYLGTQLNDTSPARAMLVVPDGYTTAAAGTTTAAVVANLAVLQPVTDAAVTLSGPHRPSVTIHWGSLGFPPASAKAAQAVHPCPAAALRLQLIPADRVGDIDYDFAQLRNVGAVACTMAGTVSVSYRNSEGRQLPLAASAVTSGRIAGPITLSPRTSAEDYRPGSGPVDAGATTLEVTLSARVLKSGQPCPATRITTPTTIVLTTAGGLVSLPNRLSPVPGVSSAQALSPLLRACDGHFSISLKPQG